MSVINLAWWCEQLQILYKHTNTAYRRLWSTFRWVTYVAGTLPLVTIT